MSYSKEQKVFYYLKRKLNKVNEAMEEFKKRKDDPGMKEKLDELGEYRKDLYLRMWVRIRMYGRGEIFRMSQHYEVTVGQRNDMEQSLCEIFLKKLPQYNPLESTPSTFFKRYFRQEISKYLRQNCTHMTQYDTANLRKLQKAKEHFKNRGVDYNDEMLSQDTGLSIPVIKRTFQTANNMMFPASVEEAYNLKSPLPQPEEEILKQETREILFRAIERCTADDSIQKELLFLRINASGRKEMSYKKIAETTGRSIRFVREAINDVICKLSQDPELCNWWFGNPNIARNV